METLFPKPFPYSLPPRNGIKRVSSSSTLSMAVLIVPIMPAVKQAEQTTFRSHRHEILDIDIIKIYFSNMPRRRGVQRPAQYLLRLKYSEKKLMQQAAEHAGELLSNWMRRTLLTTARRELK